MQNNSLGLAERQNSSLTASVEDPLYSTLVANIVFNGCLCYTTTMLNIVTIYALSKTVLPSKPLKIFILNLAVSDLGVGLLGEPLYITYLVEELRFKFPDRATLIASFIIWNLLYLSSFCSIMVLHADRFVAIHMPFRYNDLVTRQRAVIVVSAIWLFNALLVSLCILLTSPTISLIMFDIIVLLCLLTSTWSSYKIFATIRRHKMEIQAQVQQVAQNTNMENLARLRKSAQSTFWIYLVFCVCYLPNVVIEIADQMFSTESMTRYMLNIFLVTLIFLNSSLNPVIYCWKMRQIRHTMLDLLQNIFRKQ